MSLDHRIECLHTLKKIGYQTGTGIMVGSPGQTVDDLVRDLLFIREFEPQMIGIGPFIPHRDTPFGHEPAGSVERTLTLLSILRLMRPAALIPSTTALATLSGDGRMRGILAGANVVMPNLSPPDERSKYNLYDGKAAFGAEAAEGLAALEPGAQRNRPPHLVEPGRLSRIAYKNTKICTKSHPPRRRSSSMTEKSSKRWLTPAKIVRTAP